MTETETETVVREGAAADLRLDQIGAMKRPQWLLDAFQQHKAGEASDSELEAAQDRSIRELVEKEVASGLPVITDGEHRRRVFIQSFTDSVSGFGQIEPREGRWPLVGPLRKSGNRPLDEYRFVKPLTDRVIKTTFLSPAGVIRPFDPELAAPHYDDAAAFAADVIEISRTILAELVAEGCG